MILRSLPGLAALLLVASWAQAEPFVVGFTRFHEAAPSVSGGRLLFNELGCANCHDSPTGLPGRRGPDIQGVAERLQADWVRQFLASPGIAHPGSTMPSFLSESAPEDVEAVLHYLGSLKTKPGPKPKPAAHVNSERGRLLFHSIGCVACHAPGKEFQPEGGSPKDSEFTHPSIRFPDLSQKFTLAGLSSFLLDPLKTRPDGRMPRFLLDESDAADIAGYLLAFEGSDAKKAPVLKPFVSNTELAARGAEVVAASRCAACHELPKNVAATTVALKQHTGGCLAPSPAPGLPRYSLSPSQQAALESFLKQPGQAQAAGDSVALTLQALNCSACHERDGIGGPDAARKAYFTGDHNLGDTGRYPPPLTGAGRKLQPEWLTALLQGSNRVRPYLKTQMPVYGAATEPLARTLAQADHRVEKPLPGGDDTAGRKLLGTQGGLGCITCHRWGDKASLGIQALDLSNLGQRLQPAWLAEYLVDPSSYRPGTLMPSFWPAGRASNQDILGGDTAHQISSIYAFAKSANGEPEGFPETTGGQFELVPKDRPILQRTFLEGVGTHAILAGFPTGVHLAYDGKRGRPAFLWKGRFFDAYNTWFSRFAPFEKPLSDSVVHWPVSGTSEPPVVFEGYKLDKAGVPSFLYSISGVAIEDRFEGTENGLKRQISWPVAAQAPTITHPLNVEMREDSSSKPGNRRFTYLWK